MVCGCLVVVVGLSRKSGAAEASSGGFVVHTSRFVRG